MVIISCKDVEFTWVSCCRISGDVMCSKENSVKPTKIYSSIGKIKFLKGVNLSRGEEGRKLIYAQNIWTTNMVKIFHVKFTKYVM